MAEESSVFHDYNAMRSSFQERTKTVAKMVETGTIDPKSSLAADGQSLWLGEAGEKKRFEDDDASIASFGDVEEFGGAGELEDKLLGQQDTPSLCFGIVEDETSQNKIIEEPTSTSKRKNRKRKRRRKTRFTRRKNWHKNKKKIIMKPPKEKIHHFSNINKAVDEEFRSLSYNELLYMPPSTLKGLCAGADKTLRSLGMKTIRDMADWSHWHHAKMLHTFAANEEPGKRAKGSIANVNGAVIKEFEPLPHRKLVVQEPEVLQGLGPVRGDLVKNRLGLESVDDIAGWKYFEIAAAIKHAAKVERKSLEDHL